MKSLLALTIFLSSLASFAAVPDFSCESSNQNEHMDVRFENNVLTYDNGRMIEVAVATKSVNGKKLKVSGLAKGLVFPGGGHQSVAVDIDMETKKGSISIYTKTFYRQNEIKKDLNCTL